MIDCIKWGAELSRRVVEGVSSFRLSDACLIMSGGIDSTFTALSIKDYVRLEAVTVVAGREALDVGYAREAANSLGIKHVTHTPADDVINECVDLVLKVFRTIDPVEVVCDIPLCASLLKCRSMGYRVAITGDGGDELFLGYSFLFRRGVKGLREWLERVLIKASFSSIPLGSYLGVKVIPALYTLPVKELVKYVPIECMVRRFNGFTWGKFLMRIYLSLNGLNRIAWRRKAPLLQGSGTSSLLRRWSLMITDSEVDELSKAYGIKLPSKPHAYLLKRLLNLGIKPPRECPDPGRRCPTCGACMDNGFCRFCGTYVSGEGVTYHYSGEF